VGLSICLSAEAMFVRMYVDMIHFFSSPRARSGRDSAWNAASYVNTYVLYMQKDCDGVVVRRCPASSLPPHESTCNSYAMN